jgi:NADP-dependent alcohol dehydrogenase
MFRAIFNLSEGFTRSHCRKNLQTLIQVGPEVVENPKDYALASNFMWS